jgi:hypothetical protein
MAEPANVQTNQKGGSLRLRSPRTTDTAEDLW